MKRVLFFLGQLDDRDIEWMAYDGHKLKLDTGSMLIKKGKNIDNLYIVLNGQLKVFNDTANKTIATLRSGEILGEMSFLESRPPSVSVKATEPSTVYAISKDLIYSRMSSNPEFRGNFYYALGLYLSNRLRETTDNLEKGNLEEEDLLDNNILDGVAQAGSRFGRILNRFAEA